MTDLFKPEDFKSSLVEVVHGAMLPFVFDKVSSKANQLFREWLEKQPVVYGRRRAGTPCWSFDEQPSCFPDDTHTARLVCIEMIKPKDTAEGLLKELYNGVENGGFQYGSINADFKLRIRKLLENK